MTIKLTIEALIYLCISVGFIVWLLYDLFDSYSGGLFSSAKVKGELSVSGAVAIILWIVVTAIWGGAFWW